MVSLKGRDFIHGLINQAFKENSRMEKEMEMEFGKVHQEISI